MAAILNNKFWANFIFEFWANYDALWLGVI